MVDLRAFEQTFPFPVTSASDSFENESTQSRFVIHSNRNVHLAREVSATEDDFRLVADQYATVTLARGEELAFILADGETDGTIWITQAS